MKTIFYSVLVLSVATFGLLGCDESSTPTSDEQAPAVVEEVVVEEAVDEAVVEEAVDEAVEEEAVEEAVEEEAS